MQPRPRVTPKDFFLWLGALAALYGSVVSFITLLFSYIDYAFPDTLQYYVDPYSGTMRFAIASLIVLFPTFLVLMRVIRRDIAKDPSRADVWVRRWAIYLTLFIAGLTLVIDLITLINTFLGGDLTTRFILKVLVVFLVVGAGFLHFISDLWGYWLQHPRRAQYVGYGAALAIIVSIVSGFFIIGSPATARDYRYDDQKAGDLMSIQWQVVNYYQQKGELPAVLSDLTDPISGFQVPLDQQTGASYEYAKTGSLSFRLCATFNRESREAEMSIARPIGGIEGENWQHSAGRYCFDRTIDPERYPPVKR